LAIVRPGRRGSGWPWFACGWINGFGGWASSLSEVLVAWWALARISGLASGLSDLWPMPAAMCFAANFVPHLGRCSRDQDRGFFFGAGWCTMHHHFPPPATMPAEKPIRLTITVTPEVHAAFERLSAASSMSMSKCMGEWLGDTLDAVEYTANLVEKARAAPKMVMREVHAYALGLADETGSLLASMKAKGGAAGGKAKPDAGGAAPIPPPCNTGGKVPSGKRSARGGKSA